jgi:cobalamin biosynthesis protein CbiG
MTRLWLGIGCQQGASGGSIESAILQTLALQDLNIVDVVGVASIDHKAQEPGILEVCIRYHWQLQTYSAAELDHVQIQQPSTTVAQLIGANSVAEAAAMLASGQELLVRKQIYSIGGKFITVAIALLPVRPESEGTDLPDQTFPQVKCYWEMPEIF